MYIRNEEGEPLQATLEVSESLRYVTVK